MGINMIKRQLSDMILAQRNKFPVIAVTGNQAKPPY